MCAIIAWSGNMPTGLLYQLLHSAEHRGKDSTGVAFWQKDIGKNFIVRHAVSATTFTKINSAHVASAQKAVRGIAHTRRASPRMPINNENAHPFTYESWVFAHNGVVRNWVELRQAAMTNLEKQVVDEPKLQSKMDYVKKITTDSMILGPAIESNDFTPVIGCMGLVWLRGDKVFAFRSKKELTAAKVIWQEENKENAKEHSLTLVASTWNIIENSLARLSNCIYEAEEIIMKENELYELYPNEVASIGQLPVNAQNQSDKFTSTAE
jgi:predicted glutamine amidotransferase